MGTLLSLASPHSYGAFGRSSKRREMHAYDRRLNGNEDDLLHLGSFHSSMPPPQQSGYYYNRNGGGGTIRHGSSNISITTATGSSNTSSATNSGSGGVVGRQYRLHQQLKSATTVDLAGYGAGFEDEQMFYRPDCWTVRGTGSGGHLTTASTSSSSGNSSSNKHRRHNVVAAATVSPPQSVTVGHGNTTRPSTGCRIEYLRADVENNNNGGSGNKNGTASTHQPWLRRTTATTNSGRTATATAAFVEDTGVPYETSTVGRRTSLPKSTSCHALQCAATRSTATLDIVAARHQAATNGGNKVDQQHQQRVHLKNIVNNSKTSNGNNNNSNNNNNINYHHRGYRIGDLVPPPPPPPQVHLFAAATTSRRQVNHQGLPPVHGVVTVTAAGTGSRPNAVVRTSSYTAAAAAGLTTQTTTLVNVGDRHVDTSHLQKQQQHHHHHHQQQQQLQQQQQQQQTVVGGLAAGVTTGRTIPGKTTVIQASTSELLRWLLA